MILSEYQLVAASGIHSPQVLEALAGRTMFGDGSGIQIVTIGQLRNGTMYEISRWTLGDSQITSYANQSLMQDGLMNTTSAIGNLPPFPPEKLSTTHPTRGRASCCDENSTRIIGDNSRRRSTS